MRRRAGATVVVAANYKTVGNTPIGSTTVVMNDANVLHTADYWAGGMASIFPTGTLGDYTNDNPRMIKHSTASNGVTVTLTLYRPLTYAAIIPTAQDLYCCPNIYSAIDEPAATANRNTFIGYSWTPVTPLYYAWFQTWGHAQPVTTGGDLGIVAAMRDAYFNPADGTIESSTARVFGHQRAGIIIPLTILAPAGDESQILLQLDP